MFLVIEELTKAFKSTNHKKWSVFDIENRINAYFKESVANIANSIKVVNKIQISYDIPQPNSKMVQFQQATLNQLRKMYCK